MPTRPLSATLKGFGCAATPAEVAVETLELRQRLVRAGTVLGLGVAAALVALPIPLVHFIFVPAALLTGLILAARRLGQREIFASAEGTCPCCGTRQTLGLQGRAFRLPREVFCGTCGRSLDLAAQA
jgi:hypothetical protein